jgi:3-methyladenine DNA glycosylase/8-oxoguanine DNA glycosylase
MLELLSLRFESEALHSTLEVIDHLTFRQNPRPADQTGKPLRLNQLEALVPSVAYQRLNGTAAATVWVRLKPSIRGADFLPADLLATR